MTSLFLLSYPAGGAVLANTILPTISGLLGQPLQTPFAKPPGQGLCSSIVNLLWGFANLVVGYLLVCILSDFDLRSTPHIAALGLGALLLGLMLARYFGRFHGGNAPDRA